MRRILFRSIPVFTVVWSVAILLWAGRIATPTSLTAAPYLGVGVLLLTAAVAMFARARWAWLAVLAISAVVAATFGSWLLVNTIAAVAGAERYRDSPATMLVVLATSAVTLWPAVLILAMAWICRSQVRPILVGHAQSKPSFP